MIIDSLPRTNQNQLWNFVFRILTSNWANIILEAWDLIRRIRTERAVGLYEVLDFEHELELCDVKGKKAIYRKRETVRLLQDYVTAYIDQAWGKGEIFADYECSPGVAVDRFRSGHKHWVLISLREAKRRGDILRIRIDRTVRYGFDLTTCWSETVVFHRIHRFRIAVIFPQERPPKQIALLQVNQNRIVPLGEEHTEMLPDGRHRVCWETNQPRLFETYTLRWTW